MILSDFLSRQKHSDSNLHEIIPISFNMQNILHNRFYNIGNLEKYLVQTWSKAMSGGIKLPEVHSVNKGLDQNVQPRKTIHKPLFSKVKEIPQIKPRLGQERVALRCKKASGLSAYCSISKTTIENS